MGQTRNYIFIMVIPFFLLLSSVSHSAVFVYEVITDDSTFYTASKLEPAAYLFYNGGKDVIHSLQLVKKFPDESWEEALREYGLDDKNVRHLPHDSSVRNSDNSSIKRRPDYWWR